MIHLHIGACIGMSCLVHISQALSRKGLWPLMPTGVADLFCQQKAAGAIMILVVTVCKGSGSSVPSAGARRCSQCIALLQPQMAQTREFGSAHRFLCALRRRGKAQRLPGCPAAAPRGRRLAAERSARDSARRRLHRLAIMLRMLCGLAARLHGLVTHPQQP